MKKTLCTLAAILSISLSAAQTPRIKTGIEVLRDNGFQILLGKKVGLLTNPTGVDSKLKSTIDIFNEAKGLQLIALYGPEHGVRGDVPGGERIDNYTDPQTTLPVYSLYGDGKLRKPTPEMLKDVDVLVYDIQDIGCRSYTYIGAMGLAMEAAAEQNIEFVVLDRPNPLGGLKVEGCIVENGFVSSVSPFPIPYVYGLTCGELAQMLNEERMLHNGVTCKLIVVPMKGWVREMTFPETGLPWVPTSPHIPSETSPQYYVSTGILGELGVVSEGVGYTLPFRTLAAEWIDPNLLAEKMNALKLEGVLFRPIVFRPFYGKYAERAMRGVQLHITDCSKLNLMSLQFLFMQAHNELYPDKNPFALAESSRVKTFDKVVGTSEIRNLFMQRMSYDDIRGRLQKGVEDFCKVSKKYRLY